MSQINSLLNAIEDRNTALKKENEELKKTIADLNFKINVFSEKEKIHESTIKELKDYHNEYEALLAQVKLKEEQLNNKFLEKEAEIVQNYNQLNQDKQKEINDYKMRLADSENEISLVRMFFKF